MTRAFQLRCKARTSVLHNAQAYLKGLGVTAVQFQPIHETQNALNDFPKLGSAHNYWAYDSCSYFAPDRRYSSDQSPGGPTREWIGMVKAFHDVGLKVYVDVVYNHHDEGAVDVTGASGTIYSLRRPGQHRILRTGQQSEPISG